MILTIAGRELRSLFLSPLAWVVMAVVQALCGYFFLLYVDIYLQLVPRIGAIADAPGITAMVVAPLFSTAAIVLLLVTPLLTMRLISEERQKQTLPLLLSAPVSMTEIILGKFTGVFVFELLMLLLIAAMPLSLLSGAELDLGLWAAGVLGMVLIVASFCSIGLLMSTLTAQPTVAAVAGFGVLLLLWVLNTAGDSGNELFAYLSLLSHYQPMLRGLVDSTDIIYYLIICLTCLMFSIRQLHVRNGTQ
ncbi:MAG: ABC transporter permease subunit [Gammaproteobacteria bacterium]|nr:ABC transporter permease subunit [Gammaproteobacteria bacterium]